MDPPSQVDLVRALQSIDQSDILAHHVDAHHHDDAGVVDDGMDHLEHALVGVTGATGQDEVAEQTSELDLGAEGDAAELASWTKEQLQAEIVKLRRLARLAPGTPIHSMDPGPAPIRHDVEAALTAVSALGRAEGGSPPTSAALAMSIDPSLHHDHGADDTDHAGPSKQAEPKKRTKRRARTDQDSPAPAKKQAVKRDEETGKRLDNQRKTELGRAIRVKIRTAIGVGMDDPLPHPKNDLDLLKLDSEGPAFVPDWKLALNDETNKAWVARIAGEMLNEALAGQHPRIPTSDMTPEIVDTTTRTAFANMCKKYHNENDPKGEERRDRYTKKRRRWARKDLKQKRRARVSADPSFADIHLPPSALHLDYMSSEYSSANELDDAEELAEESAGAPVIASGRRQRWEAMLLAKAEEDRAEEAAVASGSKGGWAVGMSEKVLEVRTPRWRSEALDNIYRRLDAHAEIQASTRASGAGSNRPLEPSGADATLLTTNTTRPGHVAPSHRRFTLAPQLMRKGKTPRDLGEGWMWASGTPGVWPARTSASDSEQAPAQDPFDSTELAGGPSHEDLDTGLGHADIDADHFKGWTSDLEPHHPSGEGLQGMGQLDMDAQRAEMEEAERLGLVNALQGL
ncbi:hypothetical protein IAU60_003729 [Kwoniella sp. DSM 27419]